MQHRAKIVNYAGRSLRMRDGSHIPASGSATLLNYKIHRSGMVSARSCTGVCNLPPEREDTWIVVRTGVASYLRHRTDLLVPHYGNPDNDIVAGLHAVNAWVSPEGE